MNRDSHVYINEMLKKVPVPQASIWIAKTSQGVKLITHQPRNVEQYIAGPFQSRQVAADWLQNRRRKRIDKFFIAALSLGTAAILGAMAA